jgi:glycosyltransferase involved in cell wall biosynthesis
VANLKNSNYKPVIAQVCSSTSWGGMEMHVGILSEQLAARGYNPIVLCRPNTELDKDTRDRGLESIPFEPSGYISPRAIYRTLKILKDRNVRLVHSHYSKDLWTLIPAVRLLGQLPTIFIKHIGTQKSKRDIFHKFLYSSICYTIAISKVIKDNILETHPILPEKLGVVHHGININDFETTAIDRQTIRKEFGVGNNDVLIGTVGRLQVGKGHFEFLEMAARLIRKHENVRFVIVGEATRGEDNKAQQLFLKAKELNFNEKLIFTGFRKDIPNVLSALDVFAFPSHAEAFGLVVIEAMAAKLPVVSSRCDGILDIVKDGSTGFLVNPKNVNELTHAVEKLILNKDLRDTMGNNGYLRAKEKFEINTMVDQIEEIYSQCLNRH